MTKRPRPQFRHSSFVIVSSFDIRASSFKSHRFFADLFCADAHRVFHREHENLAVANLARLRRGDHDIDRLFNQVVRHYDFHFHLRQEIHCVFASPVNFGVPFLPPKTFDLCDRHPFNAELCERFFDLFELERLNDGLQLFHGAVNLASRGALQSKANRSTRSHSNSPARMQSRISKIASLSGAEPSGVERSRNRHLRCATGFVDSTRIDWSNASQICQFFLTFNTQA
jgi:hypothetical protein